MAYWWVNQGQTFKEESKGGFLWAPKDDTKDLRHWNAVGELKPGDVVFSHVNRRIIAIAYVTDTPTVAPQPREMAARGLWEGNGYFVGAIYQDLDQPISVVDNRSLLEPLMPPAYSPMTKKWTANQGYMYAIPPEVGTALLQLGSLTSPNEADEDAAAEQVITSAIKAAGSTERDALLKSRIGQGKYRADLIRKWGGKCAVTGLSNVTLLRASHIKPWAVSNNYERLDPHNGVLLTPNLDLAFDRGLITFEEDGKIRISSELSEQDLEKLGIKHTMCLRALPTEAVAYLDHHRQHVFTS